jgi:hypothetical protein
MAVAAGRSIVAPPLGKYIVGGEHKNAPGQWDENLLPECVVLQHLKIPSALHSV